MTYWPIILLWLMLAIVISRKEGAPDCDAPLGTGRRISVETATSDIKVILYQLLWQRCCWPGHAGSSTVCIWVSSRYPGNFACNPRVGKCYIPSGAGSLKEFSRCSCSVYPHDEDVPPRNYVRADNYRVQPEPPCLPQAGLITPYGSRVKGKTTINAT